MARLPDIVYCRIVSFVIRARTKTNCCSATAVIRAIIRTASSRAWTRFPRETGQYNTINTSRTNNRIAEMDHRFSFFKSSAIWL